MFPLFASLSNGANSSICVKMNKQFHSRRHYFICEIIMRLQKISCGLIINAKHEHLEQPDRGCPVNNSKRQQNQTSNNKTPHQYLKKGRKWDYFVLFKEYTPLVQNRLCFTFFMRYRLYQHQTSIWHVVYLCVVNAWLQPNAEKKLNLLPHISFLSAGHYSSFAI